MNEKKESVNTVNQASAEQKKSDKPQTAKKEKTISEILDEQLKVIKHKKKLADNRDVFIEKKSKLLSYQKTLEQQALNGQFVSDEFNLQFTTRENYSNKVEFNISNPEMILKFLVFLDTEIEKAISNIEKELLQNI